MTYFSIQHIAKETKRRIAMMNLPYEDEYRCQLTHLGFKEKDIVKETFLRQEWNIGSASVLGLLQETNILTASEFILSLESADATQQIMNDLLETEYKLLANVIQYAYQVTENPYSRSLSNILNECFGAVVAELKENPNVIPFNYLLSLNEHLQPDEMMILKKAHIQLILIEQELFEPDEAIGKQVHWRTEMQMLNETILGGLIKELATEKTYLFSMLHKSINSSCAISFKYTLYILHIISKGIRTNTEASIIKDFIKCLFRLVVDTGLLSRMQLLLLFAREICAANEAILGTYYEWYKQTVGEMTYSVKKDQFIRMMEMLTVMLSSESNLDVLTVHSTIAISAPAKCNDYVFNYKQLCRAHIARLKSPDQTIDLDE